MTNALQLCGSLLLVLSLATADMIENQASGLERAPSLTFRGSRLRCFKHGEARIVQPYVAMRLPRQSRVLRDPLGNGYYLNVPLQIVRDMKLPPQPQFYLFEINRFKVQMRQAACSSKCPDVNVLSEWRKDDLPVVRFICNRRSTCRRLLRALRFKGERSRSLRASLRFTFFGQANGAQLTFSRVSLPVVNAVKRPFPKEFWFEGDKLMLYTVKANTGVPVFATYNSEQDYPVPRDGSLPDVYRSHLVDRLSVVASAGNWEIVAEMRKAGRTVAQAVFNANPSGLTKDSWFSSMRLVSSKPFWAGHTGFNFFSIAGHAEIHRRFFINYHYGGCPADFGLFVVNDARDVCHWGSQFWQGKGPALIYSAYKGVAYENGGARSADNFLIYMRLKHSLHSSAASSQGLHHFEKNKILLFTVKANSNHEAAGTFLNSAIKSRVPTNGLMPTMFRSELIDSLRTAYIRTGKHHIVAEMRDGSRMVSQVVFDISVRRAELNKENWFSKERVVSSYPYPVGTAFNFFSIRGHAEIKRSFFISFVYAGCPGDRAFWVVSDGRDPCRWGNSHWSGRGPTFVYTTNRGQLLEGGGAKYNANRFLVYLM